MGQGLAAHWAVCSREQETHGLLPTTALALSSGDAPPQSCLTPAPLWAGAGISMPRQALAMALPS